MTPKKPIAKRKRRPKEPIVAPIDAKRLTLIKQNVQDKQTLKDDDNIPDDCRIPWSHIAFYTPFGDKKCSDKELEEMVGWATHLISPERPLRCNPLLGAATVPPRPSMLHRLIVKEASHIITSCASHVYDRSALVGTGMVLEEMITAMLLPYAQAHVQRCRRLDDTETNTEYTDEWLLPFDEAIAKLDDDTLTLCTTRPPTRSLVRENQVGTDEAWTTWCQSQLLQPDDLESSRNVFSDRAIRGGGDDDSKDETDHVMQNAESMS